MRVAVVGAGAIGGFLAAVLARAGNAVAVVARGEHLTAIRRSGLRVRSDIGDFTANVEAASDIRELGAFDFVFLTFKSHQWGPLLPQLSALAGTSSQLVTFQNGVPFWYLREPSLRSVDPGGAIGRLFADEQVLGGVVHVSGTLAAPGEIVQSGGLRYVVGDTHGRPNARAEAMVEMLREAGLAAELDPNVRATVWLKLVNNAGLNSVSALRRMTIRTMLADSQAHDEVRRLMLETLHVGQAMGAVEDVDVDARIAYAARLADVKTSMLQDLERGREVELDPILGAVAELAERFRVAVPNVRAAYAALQSAVKSGADA